MSDGHTQGAGDRQAAATEAARQVLADHFSDDKHSELFGVTELCKAFGVTPRTLRFYEDKGLLCPRRVNGTRVYSRRDRARLVLILRAKAIGSSLAEIKQYLDMYGQAGEGRQQQLRYVLERTDSAIAELEQKRAHIESSLAELRIINSNVRGNLGLPPRDAS
ncbi:MerR family transcriptional regulator [Simplicispira hankyongi]|uniref:MerR family DNA-binding transcriptional regulator n=1 Tax=Simplicispira hankyongi TaxID=2315688 RepID=A0A398C9H7_9BURK|nr:MerR family DNA-binding transcriptional regulator [Simplicispira hankyongi]RID99014.1 MerR family DNA-binding transcriptional regulator [Simplicispira hankyongi]